jgi:hypothetical protein
MSPRACSTFERLTSEGLSQFVQEHLENHVDDLVFTKLTDWETEFEYRFVIYWETDTELFVDISEALEAVRGRACCRVRVRAKPRSSMRV